METVRLAHVLSKHWFSGIESLFVIDLGYLMIFNSFSFIILYPLVFLLYYLIPSKYHTARNVFLLAVSYFLYVSFIPFYALILLGVTIVTYYTAIMVDRYRDSRKITLMVGGALSVLPLLLFKYYNFINDSVHDVISLFGLSLNMPGLNWAIPVGISFFTLQAIGYVFDVYYHRIPVEKGLLDYTLFISFFPSLVSGPINKASLMMPQFKNRRPFFDYSKAVDGLKMILWGMFMKVVVADRAGLYVDSIFNNYEIYSGITCFVANVMYSIQIYCDFAGYSLIALGVGKSLGFDLTENFRRPYFSSSVGAFWKRWHISLSTWLKDYVYIPLGGSREGKLKTCRNLLLTFMISGLWHGANWTFLVWGITHALWIIIERILSEHISIKGRVARFVKTLITFLFVNFAWVLFRMPTLTDSVSFIYKYITNVGFSDFESPSSVIICFAFVVIIKDLVDELLPNKITLLNNPSPVIRWMTYIMLLVIIITQGVLDSGQFIYANF